MLAWAAAEAAVAFIAVEMAAAAVAAVAAADGECASLRLRVLTLLVDADGGPDASVCSAYKYNNN